jgi:hypothetical protein
MIIGFVGLVSLVAEHWHSKQLQIVSGAFLGVAPVCVGLAILYTTYDRRFANLSGPRLDIWHLFIFIGLAALYSDWALGVTAGNLAGQPSPEIKVLYWAYFASERLTMLSL